MSDNYAPFTQKIPFIKAIREYSGLGLKESKDIADAVQRKYSDGTSGYGADARVLKLVPFFAAENDKVCLSCGFDLDPGFEGSVFCSTGCYTEHRATQYERNRKAAVAKELNELAVQIRELVARRDELLREQQEGAF